MDEVDLLAERFGGWWCGIKFDSEPEARKPTGPSMRFCEAIAVSRTGPVRLAPETLTCPGGSRCLGWNENEDALAESMAEKAAMEIGVAREILRQTPRIKSGITSVTVGVGEDPDVVVSYAQPESAMKFVREWQRARGCPLTIEASCFMSVCGAVAVNAYITGRACLSFGCPDARASGGIGRDRLVIGLPRKEVRDICKSLLSAGAAVGLSASPV